MQAFIISFVFIFIGIFTPDKETAIAMAAAKYVTPKNIESVKSESKDAVKFLLDEVFHHIEKDTKKDKDD